MVDICDIIWIVSALVHARSLILYSCLFLTAVYCYTLTLLAATLRTCTLACWLAACWYSSILHLLVIPETARLPPHAHSRG